MKSLMLALKILGFFIDFRAEFFWDIDQTVKLEDLDGLPCAHIAKKVRNVNQMCDNSPLYMYLKNSFFPDFLIRLNRKSGFFPPKHDPIHGA